MKLHRLAFTITLITLGLIPSLHALETGKALQPVTINEPGEIVLNDNSKEVQYTDWSTDQLTGKIRTIQYIAGRSSAKALNAEFIDLIKEAGFNPEDYQTTTIINLNDAAFGTGLLVKNKAENSKKQFHWASFVLDKNGLGQKQWSLNEKSSAIILLDKHGQVLFFKDGKLSKSEMDDALAILKREMNQGT